MGSEAGSKQSRLVKQISTSIAALSFRAPICHFVPAACLALAFRFAAAFIEDEALAFSFILVFMTFMAAIVCWGAVLMQSVAGPVAALSWACGRVAVLIQWLLALGLWPS